MEHRLGWLQEEEDREWLYKQSRPFRLRTPYREPDEIDPRRWLSIENQRNMGSCAGHAASSCCEVINWIDSRGGVVQLSRMFAYVMGQRESGISGDRGATITGVIKSLMRAGICLEETFPYPERYTQQVPPHAVEEARQHKILQHSVLQSYQECFEYLASGVGCVEIGIPWVGELAENRSGVIENARGQNYGGHAVAIVGYTRKVDDRGRKYLIMVNSHGEGWGSQGTAEVAPHLFDRWGRDGYSEMIGISDLEEYDGDGPGPKPGRADWIGRNPW